MNFPLRSPAPTIYGTGIKTLLDKAEKELVHLPGSLLVRPSGDGSSGVFIFGENPGRNDAHIGESFTGPYSQIFNNKLLPGVGLTRQDIYLSNLVKCNLPDNREPTPQELEEWSPILLAELVWQKPKLVVALGKFATEFFLGPVKMTHVHGSFFEIELYDDLKILLLVCYHPAAAYHNEAFLPKVQEDFEQIARFLRGEISEPPLHPEQSRPVVDNGSDSLF